MNILKEVVTGTDILKHTKGVKDFCLVGSCIYMGSEAKDVDFLVLCDAEDFNSGHDAPWPEATQHANGPRHWFGSDWEMAPEYDDQDFTWGAIRKGNLNFILTVDPEWYKRYKLASEVCVALKLQDKADRIVVHRVVRDGYDAAAANNCRDGRK